MPFSTYVCISRYTEERGLLERYVARSRVVMAALLGRKPARCVFLHIPKCAGSSVDFHFKANCGSQKSGRVVLMDTWDTACAESMRRAKTALYVSGHFGWRTLEKVGADALRFAAVREPFARLQSLYLFARQLDLQSAARHPGFLALARSAKERGFADFCLDPDPDVRAMLDNAQARTLAHDFYPFHEERREHVLSAAKRHVDCLDMVWDADHLNDALPRIAALTHTNIVAGKTALNRTQRSGQLCMSRADFLKDPRLAALIAMDMQIFDYARRRWTWPPQAESREAA